MTEKTRPVFVLGGNRIPFARSNAQYAKASNQEFASGESDGAVTFGVRSARDSEPHLAGTAKPL